MKNKAMPYETKEQRKIIYERALLLLPVALYMCHAVSASVSGNYTEDWLGTSIIDFPRKEWGCLRHSELDKFTELMSFKPPSRTKFEAWAFGLTIGKETSLEARERILKECIRMCNEYKKLKILK